jgi:hypothetical protein
MKDARSLALRRRAVHLLQQGSLEGHSHLAKVLGKEESYFCSLAPYTDFGKVALSPLLINFSKSFGTLN